MGPLLVKIGQFSATEHNQADILLLSRSAPIVVSYHAQK